MAFQWWARLVLQTQTLMGRQEKMGGERLPWRGDRTGGQVRPWPRALVLRGSSTSTYADNEACGEPGHQFLSFSYRWWYCGCPPIPSPPSHPSSQPPPRPGLHHALACSGHWLCVCVCKLAAHRFSLDDVRGAFSPRWSRAEIGSQADGFPPW